MTATLRQLGWFVVVGCAAAATHWLVVVTSVRWWELHPLHANIVGWLVAFLVSFSGHYRLTFRRQPKTLATAARRFFGISLGGFLINELAYAYLLHVSAIRYDLLLAMILVAIAVLTYLLSRLWAFRHTTGVN